eukprot:TRINITY_DN401_c0_g1_i1.p1 TRINITY_DN401_c0_g1~~TRINITY_DN401_c0_g1_i1.p1  ORF type:complete len:191 (-),score=36.56 TRINITY_DN401_c0_g1_i1:118-690(-)
MEFDGLGKHCALSSCKQLDFLPFTCSKCNQVTCLEHHSLNAHECPNAEEAKTISCPVCEGVVAIAGGQDANQVMDDHISKGCAKPTSVKPLRCSLKGCKTKSVQQVSCKKCNLSYCLGHRFPDDHKCKQVRSRHLTSRLVVTSDAVSTGTNPAPNSSFLGSVHDSVMKVLEQSSNVSQSVKGNDAITVKG